MADSGRSEPVILSHTVASPDQSAQSPHPFTHAKKPRTSSVTPGREMDEGDLHPRGALQREESLPSPARDHDHRGVYLMHK